MIDYEVINTVRKLVGVSGIEKAVLTQLVLRADKDDWTCFPSQKTLSSDTGFSERAVRAALTKLEAIGQISKIKRGGFHSSTTYKVHPRVIGAGGTSDHSPLAAQEGALPATPAGKVGGAVEPNRHHMPVLEELPAGQSGTTCQPNRHQVPPKVSAEGIIEESLREPQQAVAPSVVARPPQGAAKKPWPKDASEGIQRAAAVQVPESFALATWNKLCESGFTDGGGKRIQSWERYVVKAFGPHSGKAVPSGTRRAEPDMFTIGELARRHGVDDLTASLYLNDMGGIGWKARHAGDIQNLESHFLAYVEGCRKKEAAYKLRATHAKPQRVNRNIGTLNEGEELPPGAVTKL